MRPTFASRAALAAVLLSLFVAAAPSASAGRRAPNKAVVRVGASIRGSVATPRKVRSHPIKTEAFPDGAFQVKVPHVAGKQVHVIVGRQRGAQAGNFYQALQTVATSKAEGAAGVHVTLGAELAADAGRDGFVRAMLLAAGAKRIKGSARPPANRAARATSRGGEQRATGARVGSDTLVWGDRSHGPLLGALGKRLKVTSRVVAATARASGDSDVSLPEDPAGRHVFLLQGKPSGHESYHGALLQTLRTAWQAKQAGASGITVIAPYLPYSRSDRKDQAGIAVGASLMPRLLKAAGVDRVVFFSAHQSQEAGMYEAVGVRAVHLSGERILARHMVKRLGEGADALRVVASSQAARPQAEAMAAGLAARLGVPRIRVSVKRPRKPDASPHAYLDGLSVVAPDAGAGKRARVFATALARELGLPEGNELPIAVAEKHRVDGSKSEVKFHHPVKGVAVIIDDETATGGTLAQIAAAMPGAAKRFAAVTHLNGQAARRLDADRHLDRLFATDTVSAASSEGSSKIEIVSIAKELASAVAALDGNRSVTRWEFLEK